MKHHLHIKAIAALALLVEGSAGSCQKDPLDDVNPKVGPIAEAAFSLKGTETRSGGEYVLPWTISKTGVVDSVLEELDEQFIFAQRFLSALDEVGIDSRMQPLQVGHERTHHTSR